MSVRQHCCGRMEKHLKLDCSAHKDVFECPDRLMYYSARFNEYGLIVHDGGASYIVIEYCPWCGAKLPDSKRGEWFEKLAALGFDNPAGQNISREFMTGEWYGQKTPEG